MWCGAWGTGPARRGRAWSAATCPAATASSCRSPPSGTAGALGWSYAGLDLLRGGVVRPGREPEALAPFVRTYCAPRPPLEAGPAAASAGASAMMDLSDGLAMDGGRMARASGVVIELDRRALGREAEALAGAAADATAADLVVALADGADQARTACGEETGDAAARLYASLAVAWSLEALLLDSSAVSATDRDAAAMTAPLPGQTLLAYDAVRYAMEVIAARAADADRASATADAAAAKAIVNASVALGGTDTRLAAYAPPSEADADASADTTWARRVWTAVMDAEIAGVGSAGGAASTAAVDAALGAAVHARAWGAPVDAALPGL